MGGMEGSRERRRALSWMACLMIAFVRSAWSHSKSYVKKEDI